MNWRASLLAAAAIASPAAALADDSRQFGAVICVAQAGAPWSEKARGTLTRTKSKDGVSYDLKAGEQSFTWRFVATPPDGTTAIGPGFLMDWFAAPPAKEEGWPARRQSLYADGEIREQGPSSALMLVIGSKCPGAKKAAQPPRLQGPRPSANDA
jgi:hypothetical protein